jgi:coenzyme PQQ precursor peptide PqqA
MGRGLCEPGRPRHHAPRGTLAPAVADRYPCHLDRRTLMQWQTPAATDFRFGFEITMYVSAR